MKLNKLNKMLFAATALVASSVAQAGVIGSSNLTVENFQLNDVSGISVLAGTREGSVQSNYNGVNGASNGNISGGGQTDIDIALSCAGPDCTSVGVNNSNAPMYSDALANLYGYSMADMAVSGSALGGGSSGFTLSEVSIGSGIGESATSNSNITNTLNAAVDFDFDLGNASSAFREFDLDYSWDLASVISNDIAFDDYKTATTSADLSLTIAIQAISGGFGDISGAIAQGAVLNSGTLTWTIVDEDVTATDGALWNTFFPGSNSDIDGSGGFVAFNSGSFEMNDGGYRISITQSSTAKATLVSEPMSLAIFGMGLLGLAGLSRKKNA